MTAALEGYLIAHRLHFDRVFSKDVGAFLSSEADNVSPKLFDQLALVGKVRKLMYNIQSMTSVFKLNINVLNLLR